jgi:hypothetical protein
LTIEADSAGGAGGAGLWGANGGAGADSSLTNAVNGTTPGDLQLTQVANGGGGGWTSSQPAGGPPNATSGAGGNGGSGSSTLVVNDGAALSIEATVGANGGAGGSTDNGTVGNGGNASADLNVTSSATTSVTATAYANGGSSGGRGVGPNGGIIPTEYPGAGGNASATAAVSVNGGKGVAIASASGGVGAAPDAANAQASVVGADTGYAQATSTAYSYAGSVSAFAKSPVGGPASAQTLAEIGFANLPTPPITLGETASYAEFTPGSSDFGSGAFSVGYGGTGGLLTYEADADYSFSTATAEALSIDLGSSTASGAGFDSLEFEIVVDGAIIFDETFTESEAEAFFDGSTLALGIYGAGQQTIDLTYLLTAQGDPPGFSVTYGLGGIPTGSPVPEPSTWAMLLSGFACLGIAALRRGCRPRPPTAV